MGKLQRYISNELSHFVGRGQSPEEQFTLLLHILKTGWITHPPHTPNVSGNLTVNSSAKFSTNDMYSPEVVCFCDIPVEDLHIHTSKYSAFGLSFSKKFIAKRGGAPVFCAPLGASIRRPRDLPPTEMAKLAPSQWPNGLFEDVPLSQLFDQMVPELDRIMLRNLMAPSTTTPGVSEDYPRVLDLFYFLNFRFLSYVKFFDESRVDTDPENFYMEREWRLVGNLQFEVQDVQRVFIPRDHANQLRRDIPEYCGQVTFVD